MPDDCKRLAFLGHRSEESFKRLTLSGKSANKLYVKKYYICNCVASSGNNEIGQLRRIDLAQETPAVKQVG